EERGDEAAGGGAGVGHRPHPEGGDVEGGDQASDNSTSAPGRLPPTASSSGRSKTTRTGRRAARASKAAAIASTPRLCLAPNAPPTCSARNSTLSSGRSRAFASRSRLGQIPW